MRISAINLLRSPKIYLAFAMAIYLSAMTTGVAQDEGELKYLEIKVIDPDGKPMADATVEVRLDNVDFPMMTDDEGIVPLNFPSEGSFVQLSVKEEGYLAQSVWWQRGNKIPDEFTIPMKKGHTIGGIVVDEQGEPIEGVEIEAFVSSGSQKPGKLRTAFSGAIATTDSSGRWKTTTAPEESIQIHLRLKHDDYVQSDAFSHRLATRSQLASLKHKFILKKGLEVRGRVLDPDGRPLTKAKVGLGASRFSSGFLTDGADEDGEYVFKNAQLGSNVLTVFAEGWAPQQRSIIIQRDMEPVDFQLELGHYIRVRVTDDKGKPIQGVWIVPDQWRNNRALSGVMSRIVTNDDGLWESNSLPEDAIDFDILKRDYMQLRNQKLTAREEEYLIVMPPPLEIEGKVIDAETGNPIEEFEVIQGNRWSAGRQDISWHDYNIKTQTNGQFISQFDEKRYGNFLRIKAAGYRPAVSRMIESDEGKIQLDFELTKGTGPKGVVRTVEGKPVSGVELFVTTINEQARVNNGQDQQNNNLISVVSDTEGRFELPFPDGKYLLLCLHEKGWAQIDCEEDQEGIEIALQPWAKVTGRMLRGKVPVSDETITMHFSNMFRQNQPNVFWSYYTTTDESGKFVFDRVIAGNAKVSHNFSYGDLKQGGQLGANSHTEPIRVEPGSLQEVQIGGAGKMVQGQLLVPEDTIDLVAWNLGVVQLFERPKNTQVNSAIQTLGRTIAQLGQRRIEPAKPVFYRNYACPINEDGSYQLHDVLPGEYQLRVLIYSHQEAGNYNLQPIANYSDNITIPEGEEEFKLGKQTLNLVEQRPSNTTGTFRLEALPTPTQ